MKKCPYCAEEIQNDASKCRYCGEFLDDQSQIHHSYLEPTPQEQEKWAEVRRLQRIASGVPTREDNMRKAKGLLALGIIVGIIFYAYMWQEKHAQANESQASFTVINFEEFNALCGPASPLPRTTRDEIFQKYRGKRVIWQGTLTYINRGLANELFITVMQPASIRAAGVQVYFTEATRTELTHLVQGQLITYSGRIVDYDENAQFFTLANGKNQQKYTKESHSNNYIN